MTPVPNPSETPQELLGIESALDRLARADAGSMPSDLPGRIASSTWAARAVVVRPDVAARIGGRSVSGWRAAASLMILLGGATFAGWLATRSSVGARGASVASADATLAPRAPTDERVASQPANVAPPNRIMRDAAARQPLTERPPIRAATSGRTTTARAAHVDDAIRPGRSEGIDPASARASRSSADSIPSSSCGVSDGFGTGVIRVPPQA